MAGVMISIVQVYVFLIIAYGWGVDIPFSGYVTVLPALILSGLMLGSLGLLLSSAIRQLGKLRWCYEFCHLPDVLHVICFVPALAYERIQRSSLSALRSEPFHLCGGTGEICHVREV